MQNEHFELEQKANNLRRITLEMCIKAETGHVTSCMSCAEILTVLYYGGVLNYDPANPSWEARDRFILSKGQASPILYAVLADIGFFPQGDLWKFAKGEDGTGKNAPFGVHLQCTVPGVEFTTGSLGHGLGYAIGVAEVAKLDKKDHFTYVLLGDGELYEGSNWESALYASHHGLSNVVALIDRNGMCTNDFTEKIVALEPLLDKWSAYGWHALEINGHSVKELLDTLKLVKERKAQRKPSVIICKTTKGKGINSLIGKLYLHGVAPKGQDAELARQELDRFTEEHIKNVGYWEKEHG